MRWTYKEIRMKRLLVLTLTVMPVLANAGQITLILSDEQETDNARVCIYENATRTETVMLPPSKQCKYTVTFEQ
jgi:hypothetical protein